MREIKFRAYIKELEEGLNKPYFDKIGYMFEVEEIDFDKNTFSFRCPSMIDLYDINKAEIMQYTGRKDCNGKEIYEMDIIRIKPKPATSDSDINSYPSNSIFGDGEGYLVAYDDECSSFILDQDDTKMIVFLHWFESKLIEIIGNKYENPKFLRKKEEGNKNELGI
jgi:uncharacterized phage protein (TIGR01671 family)